MKLRYLSGILLLAAGFFATSCEEEVDYTIRTGEIISEVTTGDAGVTAVSAEVSGTVKDLTKVAATSYEVGVCYGTQEDPVGTGSRKVGVVDENGNVTTTLDGLTTGETYYYVTYVTLQKKVSKYGEVKSFVATQARITNEDAADITATKATFAGNLSGVEGLDALETGVKLAMVAETVREGKTYGLGTVKGLLPGTTYHYVTFVKVGNGYVYGETKSFTTLKQQMEYVDMGLSVLWAKCNIGAEAENEAGALFGYGETTGLQSSTVLSDYPMSDIASTNNDVVYGLDIDVDTPMKSQMPTASHIAELINNTSHEWATVDGIEGMRFTAANGNSIFLPASGYRNGKEMMTDAKGYYWSGSISTVNADYGNTLTFDNGAAVTGFSRRALGLSVRPVRAYARLTPESDKLLYGNLESNGNMRIEIYNEYGKTQSNPPIDPTTVKFSKNMVVTFSLTGITDNLKPTAAGTYIAGLEYSDSNWKVDYWSPLNEKGKYEDVITGDGTYTVWMEIKTTANGAGTAANGAAVFCVDIANLWGDILDTSKVGVVLNSINLDADVENAVNKEIVSFQSNNGDGRIEIYNEYGPSGQKASGYYNESLKFHGMMLVDFTISGINDNLIDGASGSYNAELSYADASWEPAYWGGAGYGNATVTSDGTYQVWTHLNGNCEGAVVLTIELSNLWKELVDTSKVSVRVNKVITPGKNGFLQ